MLTWLENAWLNRPWECRRRYARLVAAWARHGVSETDVDELARFNADRARGVVFEPEHVARMADVQARYDQAWTEVRPWE